MLLAPAYRTERVPVEVIVPPVKPVPVATLVTVPKFDALIVTVVPVTEVVIPVPPENVNVPLVVSAVPVPDPAANVIDVTVPPEFVELMV